MECRENKEPSPGDNYPHVLHRMFPQDWGQLKGDNVTDTQQELGEENERPGAVYTSVAFARDVHTTPGPSCRTPLALVNPYEESSFRSCPIVDRKETSRSTKSDIL